MNRRKVATPLCSLCRNTPLRPFLCLTCGISTCGSLSNSSHSHQHAQKEHHSLGENPFLSLFFAPPSPFSPPLLIRELTFAFDCTAWDLRSEAVYCFGCMDYVSNPVLARLAKAEKLNRRDFTEPVEGPPCESLEFVQPSLLLLGSRSSKAEADG